MCALNVKAQEPTTHKFPLEMFTLPSAKYMYRAQIQYNEQEITGIVLIKKYEPGHYRIAMINELGLGIFEMEFFPNPDTPFVLHSIPDFLNRKSIINTLRADFESITLNFGRWEKYVRVNNQVKYRYHGKRIYYLNDSGQVEQMKYKKWGIRKHQLTATPTKNPYPATLFFTHKFSSLTISLTFVQ